MGGSLSRVNLHNSSFIDQHFDSVSVFRLPIIDFGMSQKDAIDDYCDGLDNAIKFKCYETSLLEIWGYEEADYETLTRDQIIEKVNEDKIIS